MHDHWTGCFLQRAANCSQSAFNWLGVADRAKKRSVPDADRVQVGTSFTSWLLMNVQSEFRAGWFGHKENQRGRAMCFGLGYESLRSARQTSKSWANITQLGSASESQKATKPRGTRYLALQGRRHLSAS